MREAPRSNVPLWTDVDRFFSITTRIALFADTCDRPAFEPGFSFRVAYQVAAREAVLMDYEAFTNESLSMMYKGFVGPYAPMTRCGGTLAIPHSGSAKLLSGRSMPQTLRSKCSGAECYSR